MSKCRNRLDRECLPVVFVNDLAFRACQQAACANQHLEHDPHNRNQTENLSHQSATIQDKEEAAIGLRRASS